jgi:hypothetical protein
MNLAVSNPGTQGHAESNLAFTYVISAYRPIYSNSAVAEEHRAKLPSSLEMAVAARSFFAVFCWLLCSNATLPPFPPLHYCALKSPLTGLLRLCLPVVGVGRASAWDACPVRASRAIFSLLPEPGKKAPCRRFYAVVLFSAPTGRRV